jgi:hypothetical protein
MGVSIVLTNGMAVFITDSSFLKLKDFLRIEYISSTSPEFVVRNKTMSIALIENFVFD